jgi:hypothetical protein
MQRHGFDWHRVRIPECDSGGWVGPLYLRHVIGARPAERGLVTHEGLPRHLDGVRGGRNRAAVADARRAECGPNLNGIIRWMRWVWWMRWI